MCCLFGERCLLCVVVLVCGVLCVVCGVCLMRVGVYAMLFVVC